MRTSADRSSLSRSSLLGVAVAALTLSTACAAGPTAPTSEGGTTSSTGSVNLDSSVSFCTEEINRYRARVGLAPVDRASDLEGFAAKAAENDGRSGVPHQYFRMTNGGGVARAENQLLLWKGYAVNEVIRQGIAQMWAEGPGGSHFQILTGSYAQVGCGIFMNGSEVNVSQDFR